LQTRSNRASKRLCLPQYTSSRAHCLPRHGSSRRPGAPVQGQCDNLPAPCVVAVSTAGLVMVPVPFLARQSAVKQALQPVTCLRSPFPPYRPYYTTGIPQPSHLISWCITPTASFNFSNILYAAFMALIHRYTLLSSCLDVATEGQEPVCSSRPV